MTRLRRRFGVAGRSPVPQALRIRPSIARIRLIAHRHVPVVSRLSSASFEWESGRTGCNGQEQSENMGASLLSVGDPHAERRRGPAGDARRAGQAHRAQVRGRAIVVDGGSIDGTTEVAARFGARVLAAPRGRGAQLAAGVAAATEPWLLLLHADTRLGRGWAGRGAGAHARYSRSRRLFPLRAGQRRPARAPAGARWSPGAAACWRLPYGDQGLLIHRDLLRAVGGIRPLPLMEDVDLVRRLGRHRLVGARCRGGDLGGEVAARRLVSPLGAQPAVPGAVFRRRAAPADRALY